VAVAKRSARGAKVGHPSPPSSFADLSVAICNHFDARATGLAHSLRQVQSTHVLRLPQPTRDDPAADRLLHVLATSQLLELLASEPAVCKICAWASKRFSRSPRPNSLRGRRPRRRLRVSTEAGSINGRCHAPRTTASDRPPARWPPAGQAPGARYWYPRPGPRTYRRRCVATGPRDQSRNRY